MMKVKMKRKGMNRKLELEYFYLRLILTSGKVTRNARSNSQRCVLPLEVWDSVVHPDKFVLLQNLYASVILFILEKFPVADKIYMQQGYCTRI